MRGMAGQIALAVLLVAATVAIVLAVGTLGFASRSFADLMVEHGETLASAQQMFADGVVRFFVGALVVAALGSVALAAVLGRRVAAPLRQMSRAARLVARGEYTVRVESSGPEEIRSLADSFNQMAAQIGEQERMRREFVSNAAHELRTPLTNLKGYLEALRDEVLTADRATFVSLHEEVDRLVRLSRSLDALAEGDTAARAAEAPGDIDVREAIESAVELHSAALELRALRLDLALPPVLRGRANPDHLDQVLGNLLQNAVRYTPDGGRIGIIAEQRAGDVVVSISNSGGGIPPEDLAHVFERFYRVDKSRDRSSGGAGIGLAIVKSLVELGGGRVGAASENGETRFWFSLPV